MTGTEAIYFRREGGALLLHSGVMRPILFRGACAFASLFAFESMRTASFSTFTGWRHLAGNLFVDFAELLIVLLWLTDVRCLLSHSFRRINGERILFFPMLPLSAMIGQLGATLLGYLFAALALQTAAAVFPLPLRLTALSAGAVSFFLCRATSLRLLPMYVLYTDYPLRDSRSLRRLAWRLTFRRLHSLSRLSGSFWPVYLLFFGVWMTDGGVRLFFAVSAMLLFLWREAALTAYCTALSDSSPVVRVPHLW